MDQRQTQNEMSNTTYKQTVEHDGNDLVLTFPEQLLKKLGWEVGDDLQFTPHADGSFSVTKRKMVPVDIELDDAVLFELMKAAHEQRCTLDQYIQCVLHEYIENLEEKE